MIDIEFDFSEIHALARDLDRAPERVTTRSKAVVGKTRDDTVSDAQAACPVDTGHLRSTIGADTDPDGLGFEAGPTALYGGYQEFGTSRMAPQPYLLPAFDRRAELAMQAFEQVVAEPW